MIKRMSLFINLKNNFYIDIFKRIKHRVKEGFGYKRVRKFQRRCINVSNN